MISRLFSLKMCCFLVLTWSCLFNVDYAQEEQQESQLSLTVEADASSPSEELLPSLKLKDKEYSEGICYGHIIGLDARRGYIFVKPSVSRYPRRYFYLDKKTAYTIVQEGIRKKQKFENLVEGQRVVVRYFAQGGLALAEEVFVVAGEFQPPSAYREQRSGRVPKEKKASLAEKSENQHGG